MTTATTIQPDRETAPFWRSTGGRLLLQRCDDCSKVFHYPRSHCPFCLSDDVAWIESSGNGRIYSFSAMRVGEPYVMAVVTLDEGVRMMTNIVDADPDTLQIDQKVEVDFRPVDGVDTPFFIPSRA